MDCCRSEHSEQVREVVLSPSVIHSATRVTHRGFADHEYDASKTFIKHYGIELPSIPLLAPEYRKPIAEKRY
jgi:hypothetical protein